ncbi:MAG: hypothetical protein ACOCTT_00290 [archaeon]
MEKGQITLDLLLAVFLSLFVFVWLQGYITVQSQETQNQGIRKETASIAIAEGSIMNSFYALNPGEEDYAELPGFNPTEFLEEITTEKSTTGEELEIESSFKEEQFTYSYPVLDLNYYEDCDEAEGEPCVKQ